MNKFDDFQNSHATKVIETANDFIKKNVENSELAEAMLYSLNAGGKRVRPVLFLIMLKMSDVDKLSDYYDIAASIELIHTYSLIHDDLPEMDNDDLRRGKPTNHKKFGTGQAVLAGDALLTIAFEIIMENNFVSSSQKNKLVSILARRSGAEGMISGQWIDISNENNQLTGEELKQLHQQKTGALLFSSFEMAMALIDITESDSKLIKSFAEKIGLAFQVKDDILDVTSSENELGKNTQKDEAEGKNTFPALMGLNKSIEYLSELRHGAQDDLNNISMDTKILEDFLNYFN